MRDADFQQFFSIYLQRGQFTFQFSKLQLLVVVYLTIVYLQLELKVFAFDVRALSRNEIQIESIS